VTFLIFLVIECLELQVGIKLPIGDRELEIKHKTKSPIPNPQTPLSFKYI